MGRLVQPSPAAGTHRQHPACRSRRGILCCRGHHRYGSVTHNPWPPANPGRFNRDFKALDEKLRRPEARALLGKFRSQWNAYLQQDQALLALSRQNKNAEATALMRGKSQQTFDDASRTAGDLAKFEADMATAAGDQGDAAYAHARLLLIGAVLACFVALGMILMTLVRQVAKPVSAMTAALGELGKGRMDVTVPVEDRADEVTAGVRLVGETGTALNDIIGKIGEVSVLVGEITGATEQQATGLQQVNTAVAEMDGVTQQNAAMVEEATAAARSLAAEADGLTRQIARFRTGDAPVAVASPVHQLQDRAASAARRIVKPVPRTVGNTAIADDWSEF
ncbi:methyl-accepting chemotaxis protein [Sphingomonas phyllosphaerae]|uniref:methyl-accepting chemotaxis protein n=1 Tax=Sphingomonas phyllosphaerae TaxID=257003 RepID=UPI002FFA383C